MNRCPLSSVLRPWSFNDWMCVLHKWALLQTDEDLKQIPFWVQIRGIPLVFSCTVWLLTLARTSDTSLRLISVVTVLSWLTMFGFASYGTLILLCAFRDNFDLEERLVCLSFSMRNFEISVQSVEC